MTTLRPAGLPGDDGDGNAYGLAVATMLLTTFLSLVAEDLPAQEALAAVLGLAAVALIRGSE
jgi:hypothetical protein